MWHHHVWQNRITFGAGHETAGTLTLETACTVEGLVEVEGNADTLRGGSLSSGIKALGMILSSITGMEIDEGRAKILSSVRDDKMFSSCSMSCVWSLNAIQMRPCSLSMLVQHRQA